MLRVGCRSMYVLPCSCLALPCIKYDNPAGEPGTEPGPPEAATVLREALAPFQDLGFMGVTSNKGRRLGGTDSTSFAVGGLAGVNALQDPMEYTNVTWHTNLDTYERIVEPDVKASAIIFAAAVYVLATRDEMLPRFAAADMPAPPPAPSPSPTPTPR